MVEYKNDPGSLLYIFGSYLVKGIHPKSEKKRVFIT